MNKLKTFDSGYINGKSHFEEDGTQNYSIFQPMDRYFKMITNTDYILSWKSKGLSDENFKPPTTSDHSLNPALNYYGTKTRVKFTGSCLKQSKITCTLGYNYPTIENCLFRAVTLTKNADIDKYKYSG